jgi:transposase
VDKILKQQRVVGLLGVDYDVTRQTRQVRGYGTRPATERVEETVKIKVTVDMAAQAEAEFLLGWRVYVTNAPAEQLSLTQAVLAYRGSFLIERGFRRLKGRQLSLTPLYLQKASRLTGLVRLLLIGLRTLGLVEYQARRTLAEQQETLAGLTKGLPQKATARPTAEALLRAFEGITLFSLGQQWYLTPLTALQQRILKLLGFSEDIYHRILPAISDTQFKMGET